MSFWVVGVMVVVILVLHIREFRWRSDAARMVLPKGGRLDLLVAIYVVLSPLLGALACLLSLKLITGKM